MDCDTSSAVRVISFTQQLAVSWPFQQDGVTDRTLFTHDMNRAVIGSFWRTGVFIRNAQRTNSWIMVISFGPFRRIFCETRQKFEKRVLREYADLKNSGDKSQHEQCNKDDPVTFYRPR